MNTTELVLLAIVLVGNIGIVVARRYGVHWLADLLSRWTPAAVAAASSKTREELIRTLVREVAQLQGPDSEHARLAARLLEAESKPKPPSAAAFPVFFIMACAIFLTGCGGNQPAAQLERAVTILTETVPASEGVARRARKKELDACTTPKCVEEVTDEWAPMVDLYDQVHVWWCSVAPEAPGCP